MLSSEKIEYKLLARRQIKDKIKMMILIGHASTSLVVSAAILGNLTLAVLFGLAAIRNYVFSYTDWRVKKGKHVAKWVPKVFAVIFAATTITATVLFLTVFRIQFVTDEFGNYILIYATQATSSHYVYVDGVRQYVYLSRIDGGLMTANIVSGIPISFVWVEIFICATLIGLIIGNILPGTLVMRLSFIGNRVFNIINHLIFGNLIGVVIATMAIGSNLWFYIRILRTHLLKKKRLANATEEEREIIIKEETAAIEAKANKERRVLSPEVVIKKEIIRKLLPTPMGRPKKVKNENGEEIEVIEEVFEECDVEICINEKGEIISEEIIARHGERTKEENIK